MDGQTALKTDPTPQTKITEKEEKVGRASLYRDAWRRLRRNKAAMAGLVGLIILVVVAIFAPVIAPYDPNVQILEEKLQGPSAKHLLGTDDLGRDILSRIVYGARISLSVGLISEGISVAIGVVLGAIAGYYGGRVDMIIMRLTDIMFAFPDLLFMLGIMFVLGPGLYNVFIALGIVGWAGVARLVRGQVLQIKEMEYVEAARAQGASDWRIIFHHILPNCLAPIIVVITLGIPGAIMSEASLSFLGLGAQPPTPSWGSMIFLARSFIRYQPHMSIFPGVAIMLTVLSFNLFGDGLRDALDPKMKR